MRFAEYIPAKAHNNFIPSSITQGNTGKRRNFFVV
jgi:hypothetical protein